MRQLLLTAPLTTALVLASSSFTLLLVRLVDGRPTPLLVRVLLVATILPGIVASTGLYSPEPALLLGLAITLGLLVAEGGSVAVRLLQWVLRLPTSWAELNEEVFGSPKNYPPSQSAPYQVYASHPAPRSGNSPAE